MSIIALIPAYNPNLALYDYVEALLVAKFKTVVVINDGSALSHREVFLKLKNLANVVVLEHAINLGKGAALKTGLNYIACHFPTAGGVVTIDADGQHLLEDALVIREALINNPGKLVVGTRHFNRVVPFRSQFGNLLTRYIFKFLIGTSMNDTQSGLRGVPMSLIGNLLLLSSNGYEFELDMLILAHRCGISILQLPIATVYLNGNRSSHFRPLRDSLRIYFVLFRFSIIALLSAALDYGIFIFLYYFVYSDLMFCLIAGRLVSTVFNYLNVKRYAFHFKGYHERALPKYVLLASGSTLMAYLLINGFMTLFGLHVIMAKLLAELIMFVVNFLIQRDFIFKKAT